MTDPATRFFQELSQRGHEPLLQKASGTVRFDVEKGPVTDHWLVTIDRDVVAVTRENRAADCVVCGNKAVLDGLATGKLNGLTAYLQGLISLDGDPELLVLLQRVFPSPHRKDQR
jgi:putative sterol carrier protein